MAKKIKVRVSFPMFGIDYRLNSSVVQQIQPSLTPEVLLSLFKSSAIGEEGKEIGRIEFNEGALVLLAKLESTSVGVDSDDDVLGASELKSYGGTD